VYGFHGKCVRRLTRFVGECGAYRKRHNDLTFVVNALRSAISRPIADVEVRGEGRVVTGHMCPMYMYYGHKKLSLLLLLQSNVGYPNGRCSLL
jgi:hypothetical protein